MQNETLNFIIYTGRGPLSPNAFFIRNDMDREMFFGTNVPEDARRMTLASANRMSDALNKMTEYGVACFEPMHIDEAHARIDELKELATR